MRVAERRVSRVVIAVACSLVGLGACETNNASLVIEGNVAPQVQQEGCVLDPQGTLFSRGIFNIDVDFDRPYEVFPRYLNQLRPPHNPVSADNRGIYVTGAEVTLYDEAGAELALAGVPNPFFVAASTFVPAGGRAVGQVPVVPEAHRDALRAAGFHGRTILVGLRSIAETTGDVKVDTEEWFWPIELCGGTCLLVCPGDMGGGASGEVVCTPGQDRSTPSPMACR